MEERPLAWAWGSPALPSDRCWPSIPAGPQGHHQTVSSALTSCVVCPPWGERSQHCGPVKGEDPARRSMQAESQDGLQAGSWAWGLPLANRSGQRGATRLGAGTLAPGPSFVSAHMHGHRSEKGSSRGQAQGKAVTCHCPRWWTLVGEGGRQLVAMSREMCPSVQGTQCGHCVVGGWEHWALPAWTVCRGPSQMGSGRSFPSSERGPSLVLHLPLALIHLSLSVSVFHQEGGSP